MRIFPPKFGVLSRVSRATFSLDVIHLLFVRGFLDELLEIDAVRRGLEILSQLFPRMAQFRRAIGVAQGRRVEDLSVHRTEHITKGYLYRRPGQLIAAFFAANAFHDLLRFEFEQDLDEIVRRDVLFRRQVLHPASAANGVVSRKGQHGARGIIAFDGQLHEMKLGGRT